MADTHQTLNATRLLEQLQRSQKLYTGGDGDLEQALNKLRCWQSARLARTYADLLQSACYQPAAEFFLQELYGGQDLHQREQDLVHIVPMMARILPEHILNAAALALELNALSHEMDIRLTQVLVKDFSFHDVLDDATYVAAYRCCACYDQRSYQIHLVDQIGRDLQRIVSKRFIYAALKLAKTPARLAGLVELHRFLSTGFHAFRHMGADAEIFITTIVSREREILKRMRMGHPAPLALTDTDLCYRSLL